MKTLVRTLGLITATSLLAAGMTLAAPADKMGGTTGGTAKMATKGGKMAGHKGTKGHKGHKGTKHHHKGGKMSKKGGAMSKGGSKGMSKKGM